MFEVRRVALERPGDIHMELLRVRDWPVWLLTIYLTLGKLWNASDTPFSKLSNIFKKKKLSH